MKTAGETARAATVNETARHSVLVAIGIFLSRITGLLRDACIAAFLGTTSAADAFQAALRIPKLLQNLLGEGALNAAFIPVYAGLLADEKDEEAGRVAGAVLGLLSAAVAGLVLIGILFAGPITHLLAPGFDAETKNLTADLLRITMAGIGFVVVSSWCLSVLNSHRRFFLSYASPVVWNTTQIAVLVTVGLLGWTNTSIATAAAWGVLAGGLFQFLIQLPVVLKVSPHIRLSLSTRLPGVRTILRRIVPTLFGRGVIQIGAYLDLVLASLLATGSVAAIGFSQTLYMLPISLFVISIAEAELPELSRTATVEEISPRLDVAERRITFFLAFTIVAFVLGGHAIVGGLFQRGEFTSDDTILVWLTLSAYTVGVLAVGNSRVLQNALWSRGDTLTPAKYAALRVFLAAGVGYLLMWQFDQFAVVDGSFQYIGSLPAAPWPTSVPSDEGVQLGLVGLALGSGLAAWVEMFLLRRKVRAVIGTTPPFATSLRDLVPATVAAALVVVLVSWLTSSLPVLLGLVLVLAAGGLTYLGVAIATKVPEVSNSLSALGRRVRK